MRIGEVPAADVRGSLTAQRGRLLSLLTSLSDVVGLHHVVEGVEAAGRRYGLTLGVDVAGRKPRRSPASTAGAPGRFS